MRITVSRTAWSRRRSPPCPLAAPSSSRRSSTRCRSGASPGIMVSRGHHRRVPTLHQLLLAVRVTAPISSRRPAGAERLRFIRSCSASRPPAVMQGLETAFGAPVLEAYGMTEAAHQMASNPLPPDQRRAGSVGCGTNVQISIMDKAGNHLPIGEAGEVVDWRTQRDHARLGVRTTRRRTRRRSWTAGSGPATRVCSTTRAT